MTESHQISVEPITNFHGQLMNIVTVHCKLSFKKQFI